MNTNYRLKSLQRKKRLRGNQSKWLQAEKKIILSVLKEHGPDDIEKFVHLLPMKNKHQIRRYLNNVKKLTQFRIKKNEYGVQQQLQDVHLWLPFINTNCEKTVFCGNLSSLMVPILENYSFHPTATNVGNVDFKIAYKFLFNSMNNLPVPKEINDETLAMIFASLNQLLDSIRTEKTKLGVEFERSIRRILDKTEVQSKINIKNFFELPEINPLRWTNEELKILCRK